jgi:trigger factor
LVPLDAPASLRDHITTNITFKDGEEVISQAREREVRLSSVLSFRDGKIEKFGPSMAGVRAGETRTLKVNVSDEAPNERLRGREITAQFEVLEVKKLELPELTTELLGELGAFESEAALRQALQTNLERQLEYHQKQRVRQQITTSLTAAANWELPPDLLRRQGKRELDRAKLELRRSGFSDEEIQSHENEIRRNALENTARSLKEHFILERIAEEEKIEDLPDDYDHEIRLIAAQSGESPRRTRAQLERRDLMDVLRNQIIEHKTVDLILSSASFKDVPYEPQAKDTESLDLAVGGSEDESEIPEAKHGGEAEPLRGIDQRE